MLVTGRIETRLARDPRNRKRFSAVAAGGRTALTLYRVLRTYATGKTSHAMVLLAPRTGRTHQLRVHLRHAGAPIVGDPLYGRADPLLPGATLMLHARRSGASAFPARREPRTFSSPLPERFQCGDTGSSELLAEKGIVELLDADFRRGPMAGEEKCFVPQRQYFPCARFPGGARARSRPASSRAAGGKGIPREQHVPDEEDRESMECPGVSSIRTWNSPSSSMSPSAT